MSDKPDARNKGGRPSKDPAGGKRPTITFRCRSTLQEKLQAAAHGADRSVSEEIERRIEQSFRAKEVAKAAAMKTVDAFEISFGNSKLMDISMSLTYALHQAIGRQNATIEDLMKDPEKREAIISDYAKSLPHFIAFLSKNTELGSGKFREIIALQFEDTAGEADTPLGDAQ